MVITRKLKRLSMRFYVWILSWHPIIPKLKTWNKSLKPRYGDRRAALIVEGTSGAIHGLLFSGLALIFSASRDYALAIGILALLVWLAFAIHRTPRR